MATIKDLATGRSDVFKVDPTKIKLKEGWNQREEGPELDAHIHWLMESIIANGYDPSQPLAVFLEGGELYVDKGHCRLRAVMRAIETNRAEIKSVPVINVGSVSNDAERMLDQITSNSGKPLTPFEQAKVFKKLESFGWNRKDIAAKAVCSEAHISQVLDLLSLPENIKVMILQGEVSATLAIKVFKECNEDAGAAIAKLREAVGSAKAAGRKRAMPKDMGDKQPKQTLRSLLKGVFAEVDAIEPEDDEGIVLLRITSDDWRDIKDALGIDDVEA